MNVGSPSHIKTSNAAGTAAEKEATVAHSAPHLPPVSLRPGTVTKEEAEALVRECFKEVASLLGTVYNRKLYLSNNVLEYCTDLIIKGGKDRIKSVKEFMCNKINAEFDAINSRVEPTSIQERSRDNVINGDGARIGLKTFFSSLGVPFSEPPVYFVPRDKLYLPDSKVALGLHAEFAGATLIDSEIELDRYLEAIIAHESFHFNSRSKLPSALNEGISTYLEVRFLMAQRGIKDPSSGSLLAFAEKVFTKEFGREHVDYADELANAAAMVDQMGLKPVIDAYFYG
jgi:hypothetical protein